MPRRGAGNSGSCSTPATSNRRDDCPHPSSGAVSNIDTPRSRKERVLELMRANRLAEAGALCEEVARNENNAGAWHLLGVIHGMRGNLQEAERCSREAIRLHPGYTDAYCNLGAALRAQSRLDEAIPALRQALKLQPHHIEAHYNLGLALVADQRLDEATEALGEATKLKPDHVEAYLYLGAALAASGRFEEAVDALHRVLALNTAHAAAHVYLGNVFVDLGRMEEAAASYRQALRQQPRDPETLNNLGNALSELGRKDEAITAYRQALEIDSHYFQACHNLGLTHLDQHNAGEAITSFKRALELQPDDPDVLRNLGRAWRLKGELPEAVKSYRRAIQRKPDFAEARFNLAIVHLLIGQFREGWEEYAWHWRRAGSPVRPCPAPTWDGADLSGRTVFLCAEQGIGDELFFLRFAEQLRQRGAGRIVYRPSPKIESLLARVPVFDRLAGPEEAPLAGDCALSVGDLPRLLGHARADQIPPPLALTPLPARLDAMRTRLATLGPPPYLGVTWRAGIRGQDLGIFKESPLASLAKALASLPGTVLVLQRNPGSGEIDQFSATLGRRAHDLSALNDDLEQMLALLSLIDDYVGVSNTNMHLRAGAGRTAQVLVPSPPEWRWMAEGKGSPWFPGFSVYRQGYDGDWTQALEELAVDLRNKTPKPAPGTVTQRRQDH